MARNHLRQHHGGNPAQGPVREMANPEPGPAADADFPDAPSDDSGPVQDQPNLDDFAARLGLKSDEREVVDDQGRDVVTAMRRASRSTAGLTARALRASARGLGYVSDKLGVAPDRLGDRD